MIMVDRCGEKTEPKPLQIKGKRRRHKPQFKARVAMEAIKNVRTIQEIAKEFEIHPVQVSDWKKKMLEGVTDVFGASRKKAKEEDFAKEREQLDGKIGQQAVEIDFLRKKSKQLGL